MRATVSHPTWRRTWSVICAAADWAAWTGPGMTLLVVLAW